MAEVLITLAIIGIVAALTIPNLINNYRKKVTVNKLVKVHSLLNQALQLSIIDNGSPENWIDTSLELNGENTNRFFDKNWAPYLKITKTCNSQTTCGYKSILKYFDKKTTTNLTLFGETRANRFLSDGIYITYRPINYTADSVTGEFTANYTKKQQFYVDLNGPEGPNALGWDVFLFYVDNNKLGVVPYGHDESDTYVENNCYKNNTYLNTCAEYILFRNNKEITYW